MNFEISFRTSCKSFEEFKLTAKVFLIQQSSFWNLVVNDDIERKNPSVNHFAAEIAWVFRKIINKEKKNLN